MTALKLETLQKQEVSDQAIEGLCALFNKQVTVALGYDAQDQRVTVKLRKMLSQAASFARLTSLQRAIFVLDFPDVESAELRKELDDLQLTNVGAGEDEEKEGRVRLVSQPALVKYGNGIGDMLDCSMIVDKAHVKLV